MTLDPIEYLVSDDKSRLHSTDMPAIRWEDGQTEHFIEGVHFDPVTWEGIVSGKITPQEAIKLTNVEQRRIAIKRIGISKMLGSLAAKEIDFWHGMSLYEVELYDDVIITTTTGFGRTRTTRRYHSAKFLKVFDSTTRQSYFLRVPPEILRSGEAVAWTFGLDEELYKPESET